MADTEQVERLKRSVTEWNIWRLEHPEVQHPDLSRANLSRATLHDANLTGANLTGSNLINTDLSFANLNGATLNGATLRDATLNSATLSHALLHYANLSFSKLSRTDFSGAVLNGATLNGTTLSDAILSHALLNEAIFTDANLGYATLHGANLSHAILDRVSLSGATLSHADLSHARLIYANLSYADLSYANLSSARLIGANLIHVNLVSADFSQAHFGETTFAWVNLSEVGFLQTVFHDAPSSLDINSVTLPKEEQTRLHFLRGVGFTETQIEHLPYLLTPRPIEYSSLFISYAHQDDAVAQRLYADLRKKDVPCWFAPHDLRPGTLIVRGIEEAIHRQDKLLLILSEHAVSSSWVQYEVEAALHKQITSGKETLFPLRLDDAILHSDTDWAKRLRKHHIADFTAWRDDTAYQQAFDALLRHLKANKPPT